MAKCADAFMPTHHAFADELFGFEFGHYAGPHVAKAVVSREPGEAQSTLKFSVDSDANSLAAPECQPSIELICSSYASVMFAVHVTPPVLELENVPPTITPLAGTVIDTLPASVSVEPVLLAPVAAS